MGRHVHVLKGSATGAGHMDGLGHRRRSLIAAVSLVIGTILLAATLRAPSGSTTFFVIGFLVAGTWITGSLIGGPLPLGAIRSSRLALSLAGLVVGVLAFLAFLAAYLLGRHLPVISSALHSVLTKADAGPVALILAVALLNGLGEELFFRGALFEALGSSPSRRKFSRRLRGGDRRNGEHCAHRRSPCHGRHLLGTTGSLRGDLGIVRDPSLLVNPHGRGLSKVTTITIGEAGRPNQPYAARGSRQ